MQHLDEGTIHSWLDGALSPHEAARVEAHVAECPECRTAVAEARGFIAASSRILTALDNAPRGVVPVAGPKRRVDPMVWRIAATLLVVAGGTLVVVRNREGDEQLMSAKAERVTFTAKPTTAPEIARSKASANPTTDQINQAAGASGIAAAPKSPAPAIPAPPPSRVATVAAMDATTEQEPLKAVGNPRQIGAKVTLYQVAPGDTVTLTESVPVSLNAIVLRGAAGAAPMGQQARQKSSVAAAAESRADAAITPATDSQAGRGVLATEPAPAPATALTKASVGGNAIHTITWTDPTTGNTMILSGRMPEARLQEIRIRIDRERAAAKKKP
ncbi:MAG TPA: zf-HC2 domain-containing protein [Gemmatimonadaceae bacterium]|nr:zf-HC2 domain-containing protein [Gemmatimonadaceae bacterium]